MKIMLARFHLDVLRFTDQSGAQGMKALARGVEQARDGILCQPVDLQSGLQQTQLAGDGDVAATVPQANRRREIECLLAAPRRCCLAFGRSGRKSALQKVGNERVGLGRNATERIVTAPADGHEFCARDRSHGLRAGIGLNAIVVAMDHQNGTANLAIHRLADVEGRHDRASFHRLGQHFARGLAGPADGVLDLLGRMRFGEDVADKEVGEIGIVHLPVVAVELAPAVGGLFLGQEIFDRRVGVVRADAGRCAHQHCCLHPFGMMRRKNAGEHAAEGKPDQDSAGRSGSIHDGKRVGSVVLQTVGRDILRPVGLPVAATVVGDAAIARAEIGKLRLVDTRMDDAPGRHEDQGFRPRSVDFVSDAHAISHDDSGLVGQPGAHRITSRRSGFQGADQVADTAKAQTGR